MNKASLLSLVLAFGFLSGTPCWGQTAGPRFQVFGGYSYVPTTFSYYGGGQNGWTVGLDMMDAQQVRIPQLTHRADHKHVPASSAPIVNVPSQSVALSVPKGTPLQVALDQEIRVKKVGQPIHGRIVEPVYAFDHIVIPVGSEVAGQVTKIGTISGGKRTMAALDADSTPVRTVEVNFHHLVLADGRRF